MISLATTAAAIYVNQQRLIAQNALQEAEFTSESYKLQNLMHINLEIGALVSGLKLGKKLKTINTNLEGDTRALVLSTIQQVISEIREHNRLEGHSNYVYSVAFSPDGKSIASASADKTVKLWNILSLDELLAKGCDWVSDYLQNNVSMQESADRHICDNIPRPK